MLFRSGVAAPKLKSSNANCLSALGAGNTIGNWSFNGFYVDQAYGALPATHPHPVGPYLRGGMYDYVHIRLA